MRALTSPPAIVRGWRSPRCLTVLGVCALISLGSGCTSRRPDTRPDTGTLTVGVSSDGPGTAALALQLSVDGTTHDVKADGGLLTVRLLAPGEVQLQLRNLPAGCAAEGGPARTVVIRAGRTTAVRLIVHCRAPALPDTTALLSR